MFWFETCASPTPVANKPRGTVPHTFDDRVGTSVEWITVTQACTDLQTRQVRSNPVRVGQQLGTLKHNECPTRAVRPTGSHSGPKDATLRPDRSGTTQKLPHSGRTPSPGTTDVTPSTPNAMHTGATLRHNQRHLRHKQRYPPPVQHPCPRSLRFERGGRGGSEKQAEGT